MPSPSSSPSKSPSFPPALVIERLNAAAIREFSDPKERTEMLSIVKLLDRAIRKYPQVTGRDLGQAFGMLFTTQPGGQPAPLNNSDENELLPIIFTDYVVEKAFPSPSDFFYAFKAAITIGE